MTRDWKSMLGPVLVFVLGALAGLFLGRGLMHHRVTVLLRPGTPAYEQLLERRLSRGLHLDEGQRSRLHDVLIENIDGRKKLQVQLQPQMQALNLQTRNEIHEILTPDQMLIFHKNVEEFRRRFGAPGLGGRALEDKFGDTNSAPSSNATNMAPEAN